MTDRVDIEISWADAVLGKLVIPRDVPTRVIVKRSPVSIIEIPTAEPSFHPKGAVLLPEGVLPAFARALAFLDEQPDTCALIAGHPGVGLKSSRDLAMDRAENLLRFLQNDGWAAHAHQHHRPTDWLHILAWVAATHNIDCDPGAVGKTATPEAFEALTRFRAASWAPGTTTSGDIEINDWEALAALMRETLADKHGTSAAEVAAQLSGLQWTDPGVIGCGPEWNIDAPGSSSRLHGFSPSSPTRVDILFFPAAVLPLLAHETVPGESIYGEPNFAAAELSYTPDPQVHVPGGTPKTPKPVEPKPVEPPVIPPPSPEVDINLSHVDALFAPGAETLVIGYGVGDAPPQSARIEVHSDAHGTEPLFVYELTGAELNANTGHTFEWDGRTTCTDGALADGLINPLYTPYRVVIVFDRGVGEEITAVLPFNVLYDGIEFARGPWTSDPANGEKCVDPFVFAKYRLNELGYHAGPMKNELDDDLKKAIVRYRRNHSTLWTLYYDDYLADVDGPLLDALATWDERQDWLRTTPSALDQKAGMSFPVGDAFADPSKETKVMVELLSCERRRDHDEFRTDEGDALRHRLTRPMVPVEAKIRLRSKAGPAVFCPEAVGPVRVNWRVEDVEEDVSKQVLELKYFARARHFVEQALKTDGGRAGAGDNCPVSAGGLRSALMPWMHYIEQEPGDDAAHTIEWDFGNETLFALAHTGRFDDSRGKSGIMFRPSYIGGDGYRIHAQVVFDELPNQAALEAAHGVSGASTSPLHHNTGVFRIWRSSEIAYCVTWPSRGSVASHQWERVAEEYHRAYVALDISSIEHKSITDIITEEQYREIVEEHSDFDEEEVNLDPDAYLGLKTVPPQVEPGLIWGTNSMTGTEYRAHLRSLAKDFKNDVGSPLFNLIAKNVPRARGSLVLEYHAVPPVAILNDPPTDNALFHDQDRVSADSRSYVGSNVIISLADTDMAYYVVAHELGHNNCLYHYENIDGVAPENPLLHDVVDHNCLMSYSTYDSFDWQKPGHYEPTFCGKCNLRLRGWDVRAL